MNEKLRPENQTNLFNFYQVKICAIKNIHNKLLKLYIKLLKISVHWEKLFDNQQDVCTIEDILIKPSTHRISSLSR